MSYKLQYIDGLKTRYKWYFSFGTTMHLCTEHFFKVSVPPPPLLEEMLQFYEQNWVSRGYESAEEEANYKAYGRDILTRFWEIHHPAFQMPVAVEKMFYIDIEGIKLRGFIDRVDKLESGGLSIVDYKTNKELFAPDYLDNDLQLTLYQLAAEQLWKLPVERLTLYHLRSNTPVSCHARPKSRLDDARRLVLEVAENIAGQKFPATENEYCPCDFPEHCPYHRQKYIAYLPESAGQNLLPGIAAADAVERYASIQKQIKELQAELDEVKQSIISFCQAQGINRIYGNEHTVTYKLLERTGFSEDEVRALLEPISLWDRVSSLDQSRLKQFIADEATAGDIRRRLEALRQVISSFPQLWVKRLAEE